MYVKADRHVGVACPCHVGKLAESGDKVIEGFRRRLANFIIDCGGPCNVAESHALQTDTQSEDVTISVNPIRGSNAMFELLVRQLPFYFSKLFTELADTLLRLFELLLLPVQCRLKLASRTCDRAYPRNVFRRDFSATKNVLDHSSNCQLQFDACNVSNYCFMLRLSIFGCDSRIHRTGLGQLNATITKPLWCGIYPNHAENFVVDLPQQHFLDSCGLMRHRTCERHVSRLAAK